MELPSEVFAIALHPTTPLLAVGLLEGHVHCYKYGLEEVSTTTKQWQTKRHKGSCRGLEFSSDGSKLVSVGKDGVIKIASSETGKVVAKDMEAHTDAINAVKFVSENIFVTGDDLGVVKAWDARTMKSTQTYPDTHTDHITSFLPLPSINPHQVLATSGDCTLSIFDVRKSNAVATSEDQEDELLCSALGDDSRRICVGTQSGFITVWKTGEWMDHVDRISPRGKARKGGEPANVDCMVQMEDKVIVGLSDGWIRAVEFRPNRYGDAVGQCEDGVTCLSVVPQETGWVVSASAATVKFWDTNVEENDETGEEEGDEDEGAESDSSEEEKPAKKRKTDKKGGNGSTSSSAFFAEL